MLRLMIGETSDRYAMRQRLKMGNQKVLRPFQSGSPVLVSSDTDALEVIDAGDGTVQFKAKAAGDGKITGTWTDPGGGAPVTAELEFQVLRPRVAVPAMDPDGAEIGLA